LGICRAERSLKVRATIAPVIVTKAETIQRRPVP